MSTANGPQTTSDIQADWDARKEQTRDHILELAMEFHEKGESFTVKQLAEAARVTNTCVYNYFKGGLAAIYTSLADKHPDDERLAQKRNESLVLERGRIAQKERKPVTAASPYRRLDAKKADSEAHWAADKLRMACEKFSKTHGAAQSLRYFIKQALLPESKVIAISALRYGDRHAVVNMSVLFMERFEQFAKTGQIKRDSYLTFAFAQHHAHALLAVMYMPDRSRDLNKVYDAVILSLNLEEDI